MPGADTPDPLWEIASRVHRLAIADLGPQLLDASMDPTTLREHVVATIRRHLTQEPSISRQQRDQLVDEVAADILGRGPLERLFADDSVSEIVVAGPHHVWAELRGSVMQTNVRFRDEAHLRRVLERILTQAGSNLDTPSPVVDARLPDGSRVTVVTPPGSPSGPVVLIRKSPPPAGSPF